MTEKIKLMFACLLCLIAMSLTLNAQEKQNADEMFLKARDTAFENRLPEARRLCRQLLADFPEYHDATILIGRTYAWELKTDSARNIITPMLEIEPDSYDILTLLADNEIWGGYYDNALEIIEQALVYYPTDEDFLFKKANAYYQKGDNDNTIKALNKLLSVNPNHEKGNALLKDASSTKMITDPLYAKAEEETRAGNWKESRKYCRQVIAVEPEHFAATLLMAQNFAFENKFDSARLVCSQLDKSYPNNYDVLDLKVNIEIWNKKYKNALSEVQKALNAFPDDENFLYKKALIQYLSKDYEDALKTLDHLLEINPDHEDGIKLRDEILQNFRYRDYVFLEGYFEGYKDPSRVGKEIISTGLAKWTKYGTYIGKFNMGEDVLNPNTTMDYQFEAEAYQNLFPSNSLWLNYAYSSKVVDFFPWHRGGAEFFQGLSKGLEASLGFRFLYWSDLAMIYTASLSWMPNKNYFQYRIFLSQPNNRIVYTNIFTYRRYFSAKPEYFYALVGYGNYSDDFVHLNQALGNSLLAQIGIHKFITVRWFFLATAGYAYDDGYRHRYIASAGIRYYFNMFK